MTDQRTIEVHPHYATYHEEERDHAPTVCVPTPDHYPPYTIDTPSGTLTVEGKLGSRTYYPNTTGHELAPPNYRGVWANANPPLKPRHRPDPMPVTADHIKQVRAMKTPIIIERQTEAGYAYAAIADADNLETPLLRHPRQYRYRKWRTNRVGLRQIVVCQLGDLLAYALVFAPGHTIPWPTPYCDRHATRNDDSADKT